MNEISFVEKVKEDAIKLEKDGFAVIREVVSVEECIRVRTAMKNFMKEVGVDYDDPTLKRDDFPNQQGIIQRWIGHLPEFWDMRANEWILRIFEMLIGTNDLLVSYDGGCIQPPWMVDTVRPMHTDQSHKKLGLHCIQSYIQLDDALDEGTGTLMVIPGGHLKHSEFAKNHPDLVEPQDDDWFQYSEAHWKELGGEPIRVFAEVGSLVLWDSRTPHRGAPPSKEIPDGIIRKTRYVQYISYQKRSRISKGDLDRKKKYYWDRRNTSHWAADRIKVFPTTWQTYGKPQTRKFVMPPDRRTHAQLHLELAGVLPMKRPLRKGKPLLQFELKIEKKKTLKKRV